MSHSQKMRDLELMAEKYVMPKQVAMLTPLLAASTIGGVTWGILAAQFFLWALRRAKGSSKVIFVLALYLMIASTGYMALFSSYICYFFAKNFGYYATVLDISRSSWLFFFGTVLIHVPCQAFYAQNAFVLGGRSRLLSLFFTTLLLGTVGLGIAVQILLPRYANELSWLDAFLQKFWITLTTWTDSSITSTTTLLFLRGKSGRFTNASWAGKLKILVIDAQLPATIISTTLTILIFINPAASITDVWLGLPLIYPINVFASLASSRGLRDDVEAAAQAAETDRRVSEGQPEDGKPEIPPAEHRPSFVLAPFPIITLRRASEKLQQFVSPVMIPAISGVRRASQLLGVLPPISARKQKKRTFPFRTKKANDFSRAPVELHPSSLAYPLAHDAAPMGEAELIPRGKALDRQHSLAPLDSEPGLALGLAGPSSIPMAGSRSNSSRHGQVELTNPFANATAAPASGSGSQAHSRSPSPRPTLAQALEAHEIFEYNDTPDMLSPKSGSSPLPTEIDEFNLNPEWK